MTLSTFFVYLAVSMSLGKMSIQVLCPLKKSDYLVVLLVKLYEFLINFRYS